MSRPTITPSGREITFGDDEIIVSKTDLRGVITYANDVFLRVAGYTESEILGQPHNLIRHPAMPRCVFRLLWDTIKAGDEIFAYVVNMAKNGDAYWVFAHVTPSYDPAGNHVGFHSNRRVPYPGALQRIKPLYEQLLAEEKRHDSLDAGIRASTEMLQTTLDQLGMSYAQFAFSLSDQSNLEHSIR